MTDSKTFTVLAVLVLIVAIVFMILGATDHLPAGWY